MGWDSIRTLAKKEAANGCPSKHARGWGAPCEHDGPGWCMLGILRGLLPPAHSRAPSQCILGGDPELGAPSWDWLAGPLKPFPEQEEVNMSSDPGATTSLASCSWPAGKLALKASQEPLSLDLTASAGLTSTLLLPPASMSPQNLPRFPASHPSLDYLLLHLAVP